MFSSANWIWIREDSGERNLTCCARRSFTLRDRPAEAQIAISADSRYVLYINGERVGQGPARSWNHLKQYDAYEVSRFLRAGENVIAVQIVRWGIVHGQSEGGPGGLIIRLSARGAPDIITDESWRIAEHPGCVKRVPRFGLSLAFSEQYDARALPDDWTGVDFDDSGWPPARVLGPVGTPPWVTMQPRSVPFLTEQPVYPARVFDAQAVEPIGRAYAFDPRYTNETAGDEKPPMRCVIVGELVSDRDAEVKMIRMNRTSNMDMFDAMRVNGQDVAFDFDTGKFHVEAGSNLLVVRVDVEHQSPPSWVFESEAEIELRSPIGDPPGPVATHLKTSDDDPVVTACWDARSVADLSDTLPKLCPLRPEECYVDVFALSHIRRTLPEVAASLASPHALCSSSADCALAAPPSKGDLEFLLDFGEEIVGFLEFEVDAPAGTIFDFNCFEAIIDGKWVWTDNLDNTLRYTAREGWQGFHSTVRRGFRYAQVTIRNASRPVKIKEIRCLQNTYPVQNEGAFSCSDAQLTRIWELGRRTTRLCMEDTFVDCPTYEQTFWVGDSRNEALAAYSAFGDTALAERCLRFTPESMFRSPIPEGAAPAPYGVLPNWSMFWIIACEEFFDYTIDLKFAREILPSILQTCRFMLGRRNEMGLWQYLAAWNFIDWAPVDSPPDGTVAHENLILVETLRRAAILADATGAPDGDELRRESEALKAAINRHFWDDTKRAYVDSIHADGAKSTIFSQQTQTLAYLCNCVLPERLEYVEEYLTEVPEGWVKIGSPWMMWFTLETLAKKGDFGKILDLIRANWGQMLELDATTCWETFASWGMDRWTPTRSWCHAWSAAPTYFLSTYQLGVRGLTPGWARVLVAPNPCGLTWAKGRIPMSRGTISVSWKVQDGVFNLSVVLPPGVEAEIGMPDGYEPGKIEIHRSETTTSPTGFGK